jgi:hypothetical protein
MALGELQAFGCFGFYKTIKLAENPDFQEGMEDSIPFLFAY